MRLLGKNEKMIELAKQRKDQIDEGVALAQKIDKLRETYASLQAEFEKYSLSRKDALTKELEDLEDRIEIAKETLSDLTD